MAFLTPNLGRPNLQVITGAHTTRILMEGNRAVGIEYRRGGETREIRATREVLLSAGALQSPQILLFSKSDPPHIFSSMALPLFMIYPVSARTCRTISTSFTAMRRAFRVACSAFRRRVSGRS